MADTGVTVTTIYPDYVISEIRTRAFGKNGKPVGKSPVREDKIMSTEKCAQLLIKAVEKRKREKIMGLRGSAGVWIKMFAPGIVDRIAQNAITKGK